MSKLQWSNHYEDCGTHHLSCHISLKTTCHKQVKAGSILGFLEAICFHTTIQVAWCWNNIILRLPRSFGCGLSMVSLEICFCKNVENTRMLMYMFILELIPHSGGPVLLCPINTRNDVKGSLYMGCTQISQTSFTPRNKVWLKKYIPF